MSSPHLPERTPAQIQAATDALAAPGDCCPHGAGLHRADGSCSLVGVGHCACPGWRPRPLAARTTGRYCTDPHCHGMHREPQPGNTRFFGVEDTDRLPCSTEGCGHQAAVHQAVDTQPTGLGPCMRRDCSCTDWTYVIADDDVVDAEIVHPIGDLIRAVLLPYIGAIWTADAADAATIAATVALEQHQADVAAYLGLDDPERDAGWHLVADVVNAGDLSLTALAAALERARAQLTARGLQ